MIRSSRARNNRDRDALEPGMRKKTRILEPQAVVDPDDTEMLRRFMTDYGKISPSRITGVNATQQRQVKKAIRRARNIGLLP